MALVNKFNVNNKQVTLDADIIENMSANDVSYDDSTQYDENTVGDKLSYLEGKVAEVSGKTINIPVSICINYRAINARSGEEMVNQYRSATDFISLDGYTDIDFDYYASTLGEGYALYDSGKSYITGESSSVHGVFSKKMKIPADAKYIRLTWYATSNPNYENFRVILSLVGGIDELKKEIKNTKDYVDNAIQPYEEVKTLLIHLLRIKNQGK